MHHLVIRHTVAAVLLWAGLTLPASLAASAQDTTPVAAGEAAQEFMVLEVPVSGAEGNEAGMAIFSE